MQIENLIDDWCTKQNKETGANKGLLLMVLGVVFFVAFAYQQERIYWLSGSVLSFASWVLLSPRTKNVYDMRTIQNVRTVPDSLLDSLADNADVPVWAKEEVAQQLKEHGSISFAALFAIDDKMAADERTKLIADGKGFQKMARYASDAIEVPKH